MTSPLLSLLAAGLSLCACNPASAPPVDRNDTPAHTPNTGNDASSTSISGNGENVPALTEDQDHAIDRSNKTGANAIRQSLVEFGRIDDQPITDFALKTRCETVFMTAKGPITIDWSKVGNFAEHDENGRIVTPIDDGKGAHRVSMPDNTRTTSIRDVAALVNMGLSGIADGCGPGTTESRSGLSPAPFQPDTKSLNEILTRVGQIDDAAITGFTMTARCKSLFTTASGVATVNWAKVGDWAAHDKDGRTTIDIDDGAGHHPVSVPSKPAPEPVGDAAARLDGGFSVIADSCSAK